MYASRMQMHPFCHAANLFKCTAGVTGCSIASAAPQQTPRHTCIGHHNVQATPILRRLGHLQHSMRLKAGRPWRRSSHAELRSCQHWQLLQEA